MSVRVAAYLADVADDDLRHLVVPLRSNAHSLIAGPAAVAMRKRLKFASLVFDRVMLEQGRLTIHLGPHGAMEMPYPQEADERLQSPRQRHLKTGERLQVFFTETNPMLDENTAGLEVLQEALPMIDSPFVYRWSPTLLPFAQELPGDCDRMHWVSAPTPGSGSTCAPRPWPGRSNTATPTSHHDPVERPSPDLTRPDAGASHRRLLAPDSPVMADVRVSVTGK